MSVANSGLVCRRLRAFDGTPIQHGRPDTGASRIAHVSVQFNASPALPIPCHALNSVGTQPWLEANYRPQLAPTSDGLIRQEFDRVLNVPLSLSLFTPSSLLLSRSTTTCRHCTLPVQHRPRRHDFALYSRRASLPHLWASLATGDDVEIPVMCEASENIGC